MALHSGGKGASAGQAREAGRRDGGLRQIQGRRRSDQTPINSGYYNNKQHGNSDHKQKDEHAAHDSHDLILHADKDVLHHLPRAETWLLLATPAAATADAAPLLPLHGTQQCEGHILGALSH